MKISVCIPMYNESAVIENTAKTLWQYMTDNFGTGNFEIIFSDDGSRDGCGDSQQQYRGRADTRKFRCKAQTES